MFKRHLTEARPGSLVRVCVYSERAGWANWSTPTARSPRMIGTQWDHRDR